MKLKTINLGKIFIENLPDISVRYKGFLYNRDQFTVVHRSPNIWIGKRPLILLDKEFRTPNFQTRMNLKQHLDEFNKTLR